MVGKIPKPETFTKLLAEGMHTYQIYLECTGSLVQDQVKLSLLKWPDVVESALAYAAAERSGNQEELDKTLVTLRTDMVLALVVPMEMIYKSVREHITKQLGKEPPLPTVLSPEGRHKFPIKYKNHIISATNDMFKTLETLTGTKQPTLKALKHD
jgi:hypothetical protein